MSILLVGLLAIPAIARVDADSEASQALAELEAARMMYAQALAQLETAQMNLERAHTHAIAVGAIPAAKLALGSESAPDTPPAATIPPTSPPAETAPPPALPKAQTPPPEVVKKKDEGPSFWKNWKRSVRVGFNTSSGNTENTNLNLQFHTNRKSKKYSTKLSSVYRFATRNGIDSQNRLDVDFRHEWLAPEGSKIGWWTTASLEIDEFQDWDYRIAAHGGISYQFIKNDTTNFKGRTGFGGSQTFGGTTDDFRPEALVTGLDLRHKINEVMNVEAGTEYFVDVSEVSRDRLNNHVKWNILLDKESNMNLQFRLTHKYDSQPGGNKDPNDLYFDITVGWQF